MSEGDKPRSTTGDNAELHEGASRDGEFNDGTDEMEVDLELERREEKTFAEAYDRLTEPSTPMRLDALPAFPDPLVRVKLPTQKVIQLATCATFGSDADSPLEVLITEDRISMSSTAWGVECRASLPLSEHQRAVKEPVRLCLSRRILKTLAQSHNGPAFPIEVAREENGNYWVRFPLAKSANRSSTATEINKTALPGERPLLLDQPHGASTMIKDKPALIRGLQICRETLLKRWDNSFVEIHADRIVGGADWVTIDIPNTSLPIDVSIPLAALPMLIRALRTQAMQVHFDGAVLVVTDGIFFEMAFKASRKRRANQVLGILRKGAVGSTATVSRQQANISSALLVEIQRTYAARSRLRHKTSPDQLRIRLTNEIGDEAKVKGSAVVNLEALKATDAVGVMRARTQLRTLETMPSIEDAYILDGVAFSRLLTAIDQAVSDDAGRDDLSITTLTFKKGGALKLSTKSGMVDAYLTSINTEDARF